MGVEHISTTACPGAAQVRVDGTVVLVCPWQFSQLLRPDAAPTMDQQLTGSMRSDATVTTPVPVAPQATKGKGKGYDKGMSKGGKVRQQVPEAKGTCGTACLPFFRRGRQ